MQKRVTVSQGALRDIGAIVIGNAVTAWAYSWVLVRLNIISGGVTASSMIMGKLTPLSVTFWTNTITTSCLLVALIFLGRQNFVNSLVSSVSYMLWFTLAQLLVPNAALPIWVGLPLAGVAVGVGYALCIGHNASTAGLDVFALVVHKYRPRVPVASSLRVINLLVLAIGAWQFGLRSFLLGLVFIVVYTQTLAVLLKKYRG